MNWETPKKWTVRRKIFRIYLTGFTDRCVTNSSKGGSDRAFDRENVEEHGGKIWATSEEGVGTTMYFVIRKYQEVPMNE